MKKWIFPCNIKKFDLLECIFKNGFVDFSTKFTDISVDDEVYIYLGDPYKGIFLKCSVCKILRYDETIDDSEFVISDNKEEESEVNIKSKYVRLIPVKNYLGKLDLVNFIKLRENGIKGFHFQTEILGELEKYLDNV